MPPLPLFKRRKLEGGAGKASSHQHGSDGPKSVSGQTAAASSSLSSEVTLYHYPSSLPFPIKIDDDFPAEPYRSRNEDVKSSIHWGQRKLLLSEIQLLCLYCRPDVSYHIVYAGSAPGTHLAFLDTMFDSRHTWELIDPGQFDRPVLEPRRNFSLRNEFFTNATAYGINARRLREVLPGLGAVYTHVAVTAPRKETVELHQRLQDIVGTLDVARGTEDIPSMYEPPLRLPPGLDLLCRVGMERGKPLLFVSDIRSGSVALPNFEEHVAENMRAQECWTTILDAEHSMLKFRLPYTHTATQFGGRGAVRSKLIGEDGTVPYLRGDMLLPIWTRPTSTEGRLVVPQGAFRRSYNVAHFEAQFFFFNARVREQVHFNHVVERNPNLGHSYDPSAEVYCLEHYLRFMRPEMVRTASPARLAQEIVKVSAAITAHLGISFADAIRRRDLVMLKYAKQKRDGDGGTLSGADEDDGAETENTMRHSHETPESKEASLQHPSTEEDDAFLSAMKAMIKKAAAARSRAAWAVNVNEAAYAEPSGFWVTTKMRQ